MGLHGAVHGRQAHAGAAALVLRREERLEQVPEDVGRDPRSAVGDVDAHPRLGVARRRSAAGVARLGLAQPRRAQRERAPVRHRVARVDGQVEDRALELGQIAVDVRVEGAPLDRDLDAAIEGPLAHARDALDDAVQVDARQLDAPLAREGEHVLDQPRRLRRGRARVDGDGGAPLGRLLLACIELERRLDDHEEVVEIVRHAAREAPEGVQLLGLAELLLEPPARRHVAQREHDARSTVRREAGREGLQLERVHAHTPSVTPFDAARPSSRAARAAGSRICAARAPRSPTISLDRRADDRAEARHRRPRPLPRAHGHEAEVLVQHDQRVGERRQDRLQLGLVARQRAFARCDALDHGVEGHGELSHLASSPTPGSRARAARMGPGNSRIGPRDAASVRSAQAAATGRARAAG